MGNKQSRTTFRSRLDELITALREEIVTGQRAAGEFLPSEKQFAELYNLSNQSVRKGLDVLVAEGLIEKIPRVGNKVLGAPPDRVISVKFGYHLSIPAEVELEKLLEQFHRLHPHIRVQPVPLPVTNYSVFKQYMTNGMLDVFTLNYSNFRQFAEHDGLGDLEPQQRNPDTYPFLADAFRLGETGDALLVQPFLFSPVILTYNRDHFREMNVPEPDSSWSWDDLFAASARLAIPSERLGFYCSYLFANRWPMLLLQKGGSFRRAADGSYRLEGDMLEAFRFGKKLREHFPLLSTSSYGEAERLFVQGKVSMVVDSYFHLNLYRASNIAFDIAPVPHFGDPRTLLLNIGLAVHRHSPVKEAALALVDFLTCAATQLAIRRQTYTLPALRSAAEWTGEDGLYRPSRFSLFREIMPSYRYFTDLNITERQLHLIGQEAKLYWLDLQSEEAFGSRLEELLAKEAADDEAAAAFAAPLPLAGD